MEKVTLDPAAAEHELGFWREFVKTDRFLGGWLPADKKTPDLNYDVWRFISGLPAVKTLDVGSGVVSILRGTAVIGLLDCADPMADHYETVFKYDSYARKPMTIAAEDLPSSLNYGVVHCSNALDHTKNPESAFQGIMRSCRQGGHIILQGFENEGTFEKWAGFHQWDISLHFSNLFARSGEGHEFMITNGDFSHVHSQTITLPTGKRWWIWIAKKL